MLAATTLPADATRRAARTAPRPGRRFVPVQRKLDRGDALSQFIRHESSGLFAVPGGAAQGEYVGQRLLES